MDFGEPSLKAATWVARQLAPEARLLLVHALDDPAPRQLGVAPPLPSDAEHDAARDRAVERLRAVGESFPGRSVQVAVGADRPEWVIAGAAESAGADLIVVGPHGEESSVRSRLGSTAERLVRMSPIPVLMTATPPIAPPRSILVPVDYVDLTPAVLEWARLLARHTGAGVTLMHVVAPPGGELSLLQPSATRTDAEDAGGGRSLMEVFDDPRAWLAGMARDLPDLPTPPVIETVVSTGTPGEEILAAAHGAGAEMIVMGRRGRGRAQPGVLGSTVSDVLRGAECPVLVVVDPRDAILDDWGATTEAG